MAHTPRAAGYRQRAADIAAKLDGMSADERTTALLQQHALNQLADVEDWVSIKPHIPGKHDYNLLPRDVPAAAAERAPRAKPGRKPRDMPVTEL